MSDGTFEAIDANVVVVPTEPISQIARGPGLFEAEELKPYMRSVSVSQGLQLNAGTGNLGPVFIFESMRSQRTVNISAARIEVHDRSGKADFDAGGLAQIATYLVRELDVHIGDVGTNFEVTFTLPGESNAAQAIASRLFRGDKDYLPDEIEPAGGAGRIFLKGPGGVRYTVALEPRFSSIETSEIWMTSNGDIVTRDMPSQEALTQLISDNCRVMQHVARSLFSVSW